MEGNNSWKPRKSFKAYYLEPKSERGSFAQFIEESGVNSLLIDAITQLFQVTDKPDNPIEWLRLYFRQFEPDRSEQLGSAEETLKDAIIKQESKLTYLRMNENRLKEKLEALQFKAKEAQHENHDENYHRYKGDKHDPRWRIKPDPSIHVKKADLLLDGNERIDDEPPRTDPQMSDSQWENKGWGACTVDPDDNYDDYPKLYFGKIDDPPEIEGATSSSSKKDSETKQTKEAEEVLDEEVDGNDYEEEEEEFGNLKSNQEAKRLSGTKAKRTSTKERKKGKRGSKQPGDEEFEDEDEGDNEEESGNLKPSQDTKRTTTSKKGKKGSKQYTSPLEESVRQNSGNSSGSPSQGVNDEQSGEQTSSAPTTSTDKSSSGNTDIVRKGKGRRKTIKAVPEEMPPLPEDPLALELPPVDPSFWTQDFSVTKGRGQMFDATDEFDYEDDPLEEDLDAGSYLSSRGERRQRKFRSQIISEAFFQPNRGKSLQFGSKFDLADIPSLSTHVSGVLAGQDIDAGSSKAGTPSHVSAIPSDGTVHKPIKIDKFSLVAHRGSE